jgi:hypothetical protein
MPSGAVTARLPLGIIELPCRDAALVNQLKSKDESDLNRPLHSDSKSFNN